MTMIRTVALVLSLLVSDIFQNENALAFVPHRKPTKLQQRTLTSFPIKKAIRILAAAPKAVGSSPLFQSSTSAKHKKFPLQQFRNVLLSLPFLLVASLPTRAWAASNDTFGRFLETCLSRCLVLIDTV
jgi:hypothetical protein